MLNYTEVGKGEELLLIHGLGGRMEAWNPQLPLSKKYRLIIVELRGHGASIETSNLTVEQFASDIIELLDYLKIDKAHICGISLGGLVAQEMHKRYKNRVRSLVLSNTVFYIPSLIGSISLSRTRKILNLADHDNQINELLKTSLYDHKNEANIQLLSDAFLIRNDTYLSSAQSAFGRNYYLDLFGVSVDTLIIGSFDDKVTPIANSYAMNLAIRNSKLIVFHHTGHLSNIENAVKFNCAIVKHIERSGNL